MPAETPIETGLTPSASTGSLINVTLDQVPLQDVVRMFTRITGANIIASASNLQGTVTVNLQDVEWKPALSAILEMHGLAMVERTTGSGVYSILPKQAGAPEPPTVTTFRLKYASVSNVTALVLALVPKEGSVSPYPSLNALVVRTTAANMEEIRRVIESIDTPRQQVYIEAKFMELNDSAIKDLGIDWSVLQAYKIGADLGWQVTQNRGWNQSKDDKTSQWDKRQNVDTLNQRYDVNNVQYEESTKTFTESPPGSGIYVPQETKTPTRTVVDTIDKGKNITSEMDNGFTKAITDIRTATLSPAQFNLVISALKQLNGVSIVSNPKIIVANEEKAEIHIGQNEPNIRGTVTPGQLGQANTTTYQLDPLESYFKFGVTLDVVPTINTESNITVKISPTLSRFVSDKKAPDGNTFPVTSTKTIKTVFNLESGRTAAIGGLTETDEREAVTKIPLLGDIPVLGKFFFSHSHKEKTQQETIIFVTVGLANHELMTRDTGLPSDTQLVRLKEARDAAKRLENQPPGTEPGKSVSQPKKTPSDEMPKELK